MVLLGSSFGIVLEASAYMRTGDPVFLFVSLFIAATALVRALVTLVYVRRHAAPVQGRLAHVWARRFACAAIGQSGVIGLSALWAFLRAGDATASLLTAMVIGGSAGALRGFALPGVVRAQILGYLAPTALGAALSAHDHKLALIYAVGGFVLLASGIVRVTYRLAVSSMKLSDERGELCSQLAAANERISSMAYADSLTGLPNRRAFGERIDIMLGQLAALQNVAVLTIDLDGFKYVNDSLGHGAGDELLQHVSARIGVAAPGIFAARIGGDEFVLLVGGSDARACAVELASAICHRLHAPYELEAGPAHIGASIGIATAPEDGETAELLLRHADSALYRVKGLGKGTYALFEP
jgi:diguanylate cyclase (GGDEF)-like protein